MNQLRIILGYIICSFLATISFSQPIPKEGFQISIDGYQGTTLRHRPTMIFALPQPARMISVELSRQTEGIRPWHQHYGYPRIGYTVSVLDYGNREVLGRAYSLHPFLDIFLVRKPKWKLIWRTSYGLGWLDRKFQRIENEENNAIGSQINNHASLNLITEFQIHPQIWIRAGGILSHNSNGKLQVPNLGLNTAKIRIGASYQLTAPSDPIPERKSTVPSDFRDRFQLHLRYGLAFTESKVPEGPKYPVHVGSAHITYRFGQKNNFQLGWEYLHDLEVREFMQNHQVLEEIPGLRYRRHALLIGHEFLLARLGLMTQAFIYMNPPFEQGVTNPWGVKIGPNYYILPVSPKRNYNVFVGLYLKAHKAIADYVEMTVGVNFGQPKKKALP